ncbi:MAG: acyl carrier protein [Thermoguttaceae bacterium]|jgi:acyl carrier protein
MSITDRVSGIFVKVFKIEPEDFSPTLVPEDVLLWDSLGHMNLAMELEDGFGIQLEAEEISDMTTAGKVIEILQAKGVKDD